MLLDARNGPKGVPVAAFVVLTLEGVNGGAKLQKEHTFGHNGTSGGTSVGCESYAWQAGLCWVMPNLQALSLRLKMKGQSCAAQCKAN
jgi:hypothetical protein